MNQKLAIILVIVGIASFLTGNYLGRNWALRHTSSSAYSHELCDIFNRTASEYSMDYNFAAARYWQVQADCVCGVSHCDIR